MGAAYDMAVLLYQQKRYDLAREQLSRELAEQPNNANAYAMMALCLTAQGQYQAARQQAEQAIALSPSISFGHYCLGWTFFKDQNFACRRHSSFLMGRVALKKNRLDLAEAALLEAIRLKPADANYFGLLGWIRFEMKDFDGAMRAAERGLEVNPSSAECLRVHAYVFQARGQILAANSVSATALSSHPQNLLTHVAHGRSLLLAGNWRGSLGHFREAMRLDPNSVPARIGLLSGLWSRNPIVRVLAGRTWKNAFLRSAIFVVVLMVPGMVGILHNPTPSRHTLVDPLLLLATIPASVFLLLSPLWTLFLLQFDTEARHVFPIRARLGVNALLLLIGLSYLFLGFGGMLSPEQRGLITNALAILLVGVICFFLPANVIRRLAARFGKSQRSAAQGNPPQ